MVFSVCEASSSSPSSSTQGSWSYHVFLSFRGEDTRKGFTDHLCASLERKGIKFFKDERDLERGHVISGELLKAIKESMFAIIILSPNYASSSWCLDELQKIVECKKMGLEVMPVFYGVDPSIVRHQRESYKEAFRIHEEKFGQYSEKVENWRDALKQVAGCSGWDSKDWHEANLVESIAKHIHRKLIPKLPSCKENLVGIASRVQEVNWLMDMQLNAVCFIGIWGMGGIGKTTIAREVYETIQGNFEVTCFLANVREVSETSDLIQVQRDLLSQLNINSGDFYNLYDGKKIIRNSLCNKKVLLVLDDISKECHLESLAGKPDWFGPGSRIIITTRDMHLLRIHGVHKRYKVGGLDEDEALHLFCLKAFKRKQPPNRYLDLSKEVVKYTGGLPLALKVLGSYLCGRAVNVWQSALKQIRKCPHSEIQGTLKISYDGLNAMQKDLFLDIACFFKGMQMDKVINILENCGKCPTIGIEDLIDRCLITLNGWYELEVHDLLQEMGRNIIFLESANDPGRRSRLWSPEDIDHVLKYNKGTEAIQGIVLNLTQPYHACWIPEAFSRTSQLKYLNLCDIQLHSGLNCVPSSLKVLHWRGCSLKALPLTNQPYEFVDMKLSHSKMEQLWHGIKFLGELKNMDLRFSKNLKQLPDFSGIPNIETLVLEGCTNLTEVHASLVHHKKLILMNLKDCKSLEALPSKLEMSSLEKLILTGCSQIKNLPEFGKCMKHLSMLSLEGTAIRELPSSIGYLVGLIVLDLKDCKLLVSLPDTIHELSSLKELFLCGCSNFEGLPEFGESMEHLEILSLEETPIRKLPSSVGCLAGLVILNLKNCKNLLGLPDTIGKLKSLRNLDTSGCSMLMKSFSLGYKAFRLSSARSTQPVMRTRRGTIWLELARFVLDLPCLTSLNLSYCNLSEESLPFYLHHLPLLKLLDLSGNNFSRVPVDICNFSKLEYLGLNHCPKLRHLPELPSSIRELNASGCGSLQTSNFNFHSLFGSHIQYQVFGELDMVITGHKIPSWFDHQEGGEYVSVPHAPPNDRMGIALCFLLRSYPKPSEFCCYTVECCLVSSSGKTCIWKRLLPKMKLGCSHLYILFLADHQFHDPIDQDSRFGLSLKETTFGLSDSEGPYSKLLDLKIIRGGVRWVRMQDIELDWFKKLNLQNCFLFVCNPKVPFFFPFSFLHLLTHFPFISILLLLFSFYLFWILEKHEESRKRDRVRNLNWKGSTKYFFKRKLNIKNWFFTNDFVGTE